MRRCPLLIQCLFMSAVVISTLEAQSLPIDPLLVGSDHDAAMFGGEDFQESQTVIDPSPPEREGKRFNLVKGATLPNFLYTGFDGSEHRFYDLHAKFRLLDFWATWCLPCVADLNSKKAAYAKYHRLGLEILSIDGQERQPNAAQKMIAEKAIPWPQARFDQVLIERQFGVYQFPTFVLVDSQNEIVSVTTGPAGELAGDPLRKLLASLLLP